PWQPPKELEASYSRVFHLTYKAHPGISAPNMPLVDFIAYQHGLTLQEPVVPFLEVDDDVEELATPIHFSTGTFMEVVRRNRLIAYAFNDQYDQLKKEFFAELYKKLEGKFEFLNLNTIGWKEAAWVIKSSLIFVGCRSANWVIAQGLGKDT